MKQNALYRTRNGLNGINSMRDRMKGKKEQRTAIAVKEQTPTSCMQPQFLRGWIVRGSKIPSEARRAALLLWTGVIGRQPVGAYHHWWEFTSMSHFGIHHQFTFTTLMEEIEQLLCEMH